MYNNSENLEKLISELSDLPGIGKKSAGRLAYHIANAKKEKNEALISAIKKVAEHTKHCSICFTLSDTDVCSICSDEKRDKSILMVVENDRDMMAYESTGEYKGLYHVLGGALSPLTGIGPEELHIRELMVRMTNNQNIKEVIIATNSTIEGETTASYIVKLIKPLNIKVTRIATGVPVGGDIENIDEVTLLRALKGRLEL